MDNPYLNKYAYSFILRYYNNLESINAIRKKKI